MNNRNYQKGIRSFLAAAALLFSCAVPAAQAEDGIGIGVIAGEPTGISIKKWTDGTHAFDAAVALSLSSNDSFQFHADYLIHGISSTINPPELKGRAPWYYGIGGRIKTNDNNTHVGVRVPLGITYLFSDAPLDFFAEIAPVLDLTPDVDLDLNGAIGLRYYFR